MFYDDSMVSGRSMTMTNFVWSHERGLKVQSDFPPNSNMLNNSRIFYTCGFRCPMCNSFLFKANVGDRITVGTPDGAHHLRSVFYCQDCKTLYSAVEGKSLRDEDFYTLRSQADVSAMLWAIEEVALSPQDVQNMYSGMFSGM